MNNKLLHTLSMLLLAMVAFTFTACSDEDEMGDLVSVKDGHYYVDLGLSVKWATCNVGASSPEFFGDYFAWGETQPKFQYDLSTYKWCEGTYNMLIKYNPQKTKLAISDDVAHVKWGGDWRVPTDAEFIELCEKCTWVKTTYNGVVGCVVTSKINGKSIFLPAAGCRVNDGLSRAGMCGFYWSSSLYADDPYYAGCLCFDSSYVGWSYDSRSSGLSVRPVCP